MKHTAQQRRPQTHWYIIGGNGNLEDGLQDGPCLNGIELRSVDLLRD